MTVRRYSWQEALDRIYRTFRGDSLNDAPGALNPPTYSHDESLSRLAELLNSSLPGESITLPGFNDQHTTVHAGGVAAGSFTTLVVGSGGSTFSINSAGRVSLAGSVAKLGDYLYVNTGDFEKGVADYPGLEAFKTGLLLYWFDKDNGENLYFSIGLPGGYEAGSDIGVWVDWVPKSTSTGTVAWGLEFSGVAYPGVAPDTDVLHSSTSGAPNLTANKYYSTWIGTITGSVYELDEWDYIVGRLFRDASGTYHGDSYDDDIGLLGLSFAITKDSLGDVVLP